jgi:hypothetical protein
LASKILLFYKFNEKNYHDFFDGKCDKIIQPILLWEYIFLRGILFLHLDFVLEIIPDDFKLDKSHIDSLTDIMRKDLPLIKGINRYIHDNKVSLVSYTAVELDWNII